MQDLKSDSTWIEKLGTALPPLIVIGFIGWNAISAAIGFTKTYLSPTTAPKTVKVTKTSLTIDGKTVPIVTSKFTPNGSFTIGKASKDPMYGFTAYPFQLVSWQDMPDENALKEKVRLFEAKTGVPRMVAYSLHGPTPNSYGCVVVPSGLESLPGDLEGRTIEINTGES